MQEVFREASDDGWAAVVGNERLTGLAGAVLLPLVLVVIVTAANAHALLPIHIFVGFLLIGPLAVMVGSTGYRFARYYANSPAFVRRGKPLLALRVLGPVLLVTTGMVVATGIALLLTGPSVLVLHVFSALFWLPTIVIHAAAHAPQIPRLIADDWTHHGPGFPTGRERRLGLVFAAVVLGAIAAVAIQPLAATFQAWSRTVDYGPGPFIVGLLVAAIALVITRPLRWTDR